MNNKNKLLDFVTAGLPRTKIKISTGKFVTIRAFAVKEMKLLMMAYTSGTAQDTQVLQVLSQCIETKGIDAFSLPAHDVERLYIELYKLSKGTSLIPVNYRCTHENEEGKPCGNAINVNINLNNVKIVGGGESTVELGNGLILNMRYPTVTEYDYFHDDDSDESYSYAFNMAMRCIESINTGTETLVVGQDVTSEEISEVIEYLDEVSFGKLIGFVKNIPTVGMSFPLKCSKCGHEEIVELRGLADFFD